MLENSSLTRLDKLKLTQVELETRRREAAASELESLEDQLREWNDKYLELKKICGLIEKNKDLLKGHMFSYTKKCEFYKGKLTQVDINKLNKQTLESKLKAKQVSDMRQELDKVQSALSEFSDILPTNESLKEKIDELKKSRLSLDMTFADDSR